MHTGSSPVDVPTLSYRALELKVFWAIRKLEGAVGENKTSNHSRNIHWTLNCVPRAVLGPRVRARNKTDKS